MDRNLEEGVVVELRRRLDRVPALLTQRLPRLRLTHLHRLRDLELVHRELRTVVAGLHRLPLRPLVLRGLVPVTLRVVAPVVCHRGHEPLSLPPHRVEGVRQFRHPRVSETLVQKF